MTSRSLLAAALYLVPAVLFTEIARQQWIFRRHRHTTGRLFHLMPVATSVLAIHYAILVAHALVPGALPPDPMRQIQAPWYGEVEASWLVAIAFMRHLLRLMPLPEDPPTTAWLVGNYGLGIGGAIALIVLRLWPDSGPTQQVIAHRVFEAALATLGVLSFRQLRANARPGGWGPEHAGELRGPDVRILRIGFAAAFLAVPVVWFAGGGEFTMLSFEVVMGLTIALPIATRMAGQIVPESIVTFMLFGVGAVVVGVYTSMLEQASVALHPMIGAIAVAAMLALATTGQRLARTGVRRLLFGRREGRAAELQAFLQSSSAELGVVECCRRALVELMRVRGIPGAAIIFADGEVLTAGTFDVDELRAVWPVGAAAAALPAGSYGTMELRELPVGLREALVQSAVGLGAAAIRSRRRHWGHLFMRTGFFGGTFREDDAETFQGFVDQLALVLDSADLLARTIAAERSLAHAEKLAAIGELAARFAHDIRNPVTGARSLAQQLARDPTSPANAEHAGIILEELERVERQVRDLLRFSRRDELVVVPTDVSALVRTAARDFAARLGDGGIELGLDITDGVVARADGEKMRRVLVNLIENAMDALANGRPEKHLVLAVARDDGHAVVRITDDGAGIPVEAHASVFDPFVSLKPTGTGLGLAIAKRIVDAHGGAITLSSRPGATAFEIRLPLAHEGAA